MLNKKHNLKSGKGKDKKKGFQWKNKTDNPPKNKKHFVIEYCDVVLFMKQKQREKIKKNKNNEAKKANKKDRKQEQKK